MCCPELGDYLGAESCCFHSIGADLELGMSRRVECESIGGEGKREKGIMKSSKEFPPPLPWLARTGNSPASRMPWIFRRQLTEDGRLIITGEKTDRHEYIEAHRSDGHLRLNLVPLNVVGGGESFMNDPDEEEEEEEEEMYGGDHCSDGDDGFDSSEDDDRTAAVLEDRSALTNGGSLITDSCGGGGGGRGIMCFNEFLFGVAVTTISPVQT